MHRSSLFVQIDACTVDAVPHSGFILGTIFEYMSKMAVTLAASHLSPLHPMTHVHIFLDLGVL